MKERYNIININRPYMLYTDGSPLILFASSLIKDTETGRIIQQIKFENISQQNIIAIYVEVQAFTIAGDEIEGVKEFQYLDLGFAPNRSFGDQVPIYMPENITRKTNVIIKRVFFEDGSEWSAPDSEWEPIKEATPREPLEDAELEKQFKIKFGENYRVVPEKYKDLWFCACGALNKQSLDVCRNCARTQSVFDPIDYEELEKEKEERLEKERIEAEQAALKRAANIKKAKKVAIIGVPSLAVIIIALVVIFNVVIPNVKYSNAQELMQAENYKEAMAIFDELGDFGNAVSLSFECEKAAIKTAAKGDIVTFGTDDDGKVEWIVVSNDSGKVLMTQTKAFDWVTNSSLAKRLNECYTKYFNDNEKTLISGNKLTSLSKTEKESMTTDVEGVNNYWLSSTTTITKTSGYYYVTVNTYTYPEYVTGSGIVSYTSSTSEAHGIRPAVLVEVK